ncbi:uncharacterized protein LOC127263052 [Andrographis paniculata]|uniref:uncharacterized protein LOC127263052 n=1 Tax=Andrographis paniculata TaxID=175694 RepID=UPI0021E91E3B|nr:uncharacterized protein LOC127263052 [Andrographis paniculata]
MDKFSRSKSSRESSRGVHPTPTPTPTTMNNLRSYSTNTSNSNYKKGSNGRSGGDGFSAKNWGFNLDPELQRKKRVAGYKAYSMEGKMRGSFKKSFSWIKTTCNQVVHGFWA